MITLVGVLQAIVWGCLTGAVWALGLALMTRLGAQTVRYLYWPWTSLCLMGALWAGVDRG